MASKLIVLKTSNVSLLYFIFIYIIYLFIYYYIFVHPCTFMKGNWSVSANLSEGDFV